MPGYTVDSKIITSFFFKFFAISFEAFSRYDKSGFFFLSIGVGTVTIKKLAFLISLFLIENIDLFFN